MDPRLDFFLNRVSTRLQRFRLAWLLAGCWFVLGVGLLVLALNDEKLARSSFGVWLTRNHHLNLWVLVTGIALATLLVAWLFARSSFLNRKDLAARVEHHYPNLDHRLVTAVEVKPEHVSSFLRRSLIDETVLHAATNDWRQVVSSKRMIAAWSVQFVTLAFTGVGLLLLVSDSQAKERLQKNIVPIFGLKSKMIVEPGNAEIERGTNCLVTVRFDGEAPAQVKMRYRAGNDDDVEVALERSLKDPIFAGYLSNIQADTHYRIESETGTSPEHKLTVFDFPALVGCDAEIEPAAYAKQPTRFVKNTRRVTVPEGSKLTWICTMNKPLASAKLISVSRSKASSDDGGSDLEKRSERTGKTIDLQVDPENPSVYRTTIEVFEDHQWQLHLEDEAKRASKIKEILHVKVTPNLPPEIKKETAGDLIVSPLEEITVGVKIREDFGLVRAGVVYQLASEESKEISISTDAQHSDSPGKEAKSPTKRSGFEIPVKHMLDFEALNAKPDQLLSYYFWAEDLDRIGNVRRTDSEIYFAEVRPFDEIFREGQSPSGEPSEKEQSPQAQQAEELAELQKKIISGTWNLLRERSAKLSSENVKVLVDSQQQAIEMTLPLEEKLTDAASKKHLEAARKAMEEAVKSLSDSYLMLEPKTNPERESNSVPTESATKTLDLKESSSRTTKASPLLRSAVTQEQQAYEALLRLRAREHQIVKSKSSQSKSSSQSKKNRQQQIEQLKLDDEKERYEEEKQATPEDSQENREMRQVMNRLEELARRQQDLNRQLKDIETAIQEAKTEEIKQELEEQLKRLRENQEELLRDTDEMLERMQESKPSSSSQETMQKAQQQVEQARSDIQEAAQALSQSQPSPSQALSAGSRAERQLDETREQLRAQSAERFEDTMKSMLEEARELEKKQAELSQKTLGKDASTPSPKNSSAKGQAGSSGKQTAAEKSSNQGQEANPRPQDNAGSPTSDEKSKSLAESTDDQVGGLRSTKDGEPEDEEARQSDWREQKERLNKLMDQMQETISEAEPSEPLLSEKLYEAFRSAEQRGLEERLQVVPQLVERGYAEPVRQTLEELDEGVQQLRSGIEAAAESVLGSEEAGLKRALGELKEAEKMLNQELAIAGKEPNAKEAEDVESPASNTNQANSNQATRPTKATKKIRRPSPMPKKTMAHRRKVSPKRTAKEAKEKGRASQEILPPKRLTLNQEPYPNNRDRTLPTLLPPILRNKTKAPKTPVQPPERIEREAIDKNKRV